MTDVLFVIFILVVMARLFEPECGWVKYWRECPLWHEPEDKP